MLKLNASALFNERTFCASTPHGLPNIRLPRMEMDLNRAPMFLPDDAVLFESGNDRLPKDGTDKIPPHSFSVCRRQSLGSFGNAE
jgi:hypothetical protein